MSSSSIASSVHWVCTFFAQTYFPLCFGFFITTRLLFILLLNISFALCAHHTNIRLIRFACNEPQLCCYNQFQNKKYVFYVISCICICVLRCDLVGINVHMYICIHISACISSSQYKLFCGLQQV